MVAKHPKYFLFLFCFSFVFSLHAQKTKKDSLFLLLNSVTSDSIKSDVFHQLFLETDSVKYAKQGYELAKKSNDKNNIAISLLDIGRWYYFSGREDIAFNYLIKSIKIAEEIKNKKVLKNAYRILGFIYRPKEPLKAKEYYEKSLKICEETGDEMSASYALSAIGNIYEGIYDPSGSGNKKALEYYIKSLNIRTKKGSDSEIASSLNETSRIYDELGMHTQALEYRIKGLALAEKVNDINNQVYLNNVIGNDYANRLHDHKTGLNYQLKAFELGQKMENNHDVLYNIARQIALCYNALGDYKNASKYFIIRGEYFDSLQIKTKINDYNLSNIKIGLEKELEKQKLLLKDSQILNERANTEKQTALRNLFFIGFFIVLALIAFLFRGFKIKQNLNRELSIKNKKIETAYRSLSKSESNFKQITETINDVFYLYNIKEKKYEYVSPNCTEVLGLTPSYFYEGKSTKVIVHKDDLALVIDANVKIDNGIPYDIEYKIVFDGNIKWIAEKSTPIYDSNGLLIKNSGVCRDITKRKIAEEALRKKNKDITDSIIYARTIQDAVLVPEEKIQKKLNDFFILSKPKDIVSGDFYFYKETKNGILVAVADCTGHGVPAGFMSMIGNAFLNEIINANEYYTPAQILNELRDKIISSLHQKTVDSDSKDGMDIALLYFNTDMTKVQFAGAFNPLYLIKKNQLIEYKADSFPIGIHVFDQVTPFTNNFIDLEKGDSLYIFTDGYIDQFGGPKGRKLMKKQFQEILLSVQNKKMIEQKSILENDFQEWKGQLDQIDDVMIFGIKI